MGLCHPLIQKSVDKISRAFFNQAFRSQTSRKNLKKTYID